MTIQLPARGLLSSDRSCMSRDVITLTTVPTPNAHIPSGCTTESELSATSIALTMNLIAPPLHVLQASVALRPRAPTPKRGSKTLHIGTQMIPPMQYCPSSTFPRYAHGILPFEVAIGYRSATPYRQSILPSDTAIGYRAPCPWNGSLVPEVLHAICNYHLKGSNHKMGQNTPISKRISHIHSHRSRMPSFRDICHAPSTW